MPRYQDDGFTLVTWVLAITTKNAPTVAELTGGVDLECHLTKEGLNVSVGQNAIEDGAFCEKFDAQLAGSYGVTAELTMKRRTQGDAEDPWGFFAYKDQGFIVVRTGIDLDITPAYAAGQEVIVYPAEAGQRQPLAPQQNTQSRMMVPFFITSTPAWDAVVAA